jgi:hypothetical protein
MAGGGGTMMSSVTEERDLFVISRESAGPEILGQGT